MTLHAYLPQDRLRAIANNTTLPDRASGSALFADIAGFTALTESLQEKFGIRQGAEELNKTLSVVYGALIHELESHGGSVITFAGDAVLCWFDDTHGHAPSSAIAAAFAMQNEMRAFVELSMPRSIIARLSVKITIASGTVRRFMVGDPEILKFDLLAGDIVTRTSTADHLSERGEVLLDEASVQALGDALTVKEWRTDETTQERFAVAAQFNGTDTTSSPSKILRMPPPNKLMSWMHYPLLKREQDGQGQLPTEFRPCVALFVRFTGIDYDADEAGAQLDQFICQTQEIVARHGGAFLQVTIGDKGSYAYINFGALTTHEDDVRRAVKAALELKQAARELKTLAPLQIGITHGILRVGPYGGNTRKTFGALGDDVNLAARLMMNAAADEILLSGHAHKAVDNQFLFEPRPPLPVKGRAEPLTVFALTGDRQQRAIRLQEPFYALPMVGRQNELEVINNKLDLTLQGKSQIIGIVAEAGMGKSRLVAEVIRSAHRKGFVGYGGACQSDGVHTPYLAWKPIWQAFFDVDPSAPLKKQMRSIEGEIEDHAPERLQAMPLLNVMLDLEIPDNDFTKSLEPQYRKSALRVLLEDCLRTASKDEPLLIVIEDMHWIDALSHDLLEELARAMAGNRVCFLLAYRPPQLQRLQAPRIEAMPNFTKIDLPELNQTEAESAIRAKLLQLYPARGGALPESLVDALMRRAQGNPFYLEELLNYVRDRGLDPSDIQNIELPDSLHTLILSRIDQLSEQEKTTLRVASIVGRLFRAQWLTGYYPELGSFLQVKAALDALDSLDITPLDSPEPELAYLFKHIVTHEVTYESLPFATRAKLHEQLARYLETIVGATRESPLLDTITFHYLRSENKEKQIEYLRKAAEAAFNVSALITAIEYSTRLLELTPDDDPGRSALAYQLAYSHYLLGDYPATRTAIAQAQAAAMTDTDRVSALALLGEMTGSTMGDYAEAKTILAQAVPLARASGDRLTLCRALNGMGDVNWRLGNLDEARAAQEESLTLARELRDVTHELIALNALGPIAAGQGNLDEAERLLTELHVRAVAVGNREREMTALGNLGMVAFDRKDYTVARGYFQQSIALSREIDVQDRLANGLINLAGVNIQLGELPAAQADLREGLALALRLGTLTFVVPAVVTFAELAYVEGQTQRALALLGLARKHPAWSSDHQRDLDRVLAEWVLDPSVVEAGLAKGAAVDWDETIGELLK
jgi:class 3 adenylate cyclase/tetratricopeptide (TPR) repeat protein